MWAKYLWCCSVAKLCPTLQPSGPQHTRLPCPSVFPKVCSESCRLSRWCCLWQGFNSFPSFWMRKIILKWAPQVCFVLYILLLLCSSPLSLPALPLTLLLFSQLLARISHIVVHWSSSCPGGAGRARGDDKGIRVGWEEKWSSVDTRCPVGAGNCPHYSDTVPSLNTRYSCLLVSIILWLW